MDETKLILMRALRDMVFADGEVRKEEKDLLFMIAETEDLTDEERAELKKPSPRISLDELPKVLPKKEDQVKLYELSVLASLVDGVESPEELDRLRQLAQALSLDRQDIAGALERARDRVFAMSYEEF